jgi:TolB protein
VFDSDLDVQEAVHASINVYIMNADGSNPWRLYTHGESPSWSPDGQRIAFTGLRSGRWQVCLINVDGSGYRQVTTGGYDARYPVWSPDGRWLAFAGNRDGHWEIYVVPIDGTGHPGVIYPLRVTFSGRADSSYPAWGEQPKGN